MDLDILLPRQDKIKYPFLSPQSCRSPPSKTILPRRMSPYALDQALGKYMEGEMDYFSDYLGGDKDLVKMIYNLIRNPSHRFQTKKVEDFIAMLPKKQQFNEKRAYKVYEAILDKKRKMEKRLPANKMIRAIEGPMDRIKRQLSELDQDLDHEAWLRHTEESLQYQLGPELYLAYRTTFEDLMKKRMNSEKSIEDLSEKVLEKIWRSNPNVFPSSQKQGFFQRRLPPPSAINLEKRSYDQYMDIPSRQGTKMDKMALMGRMTRQEFKKHWADPKIHPDQLDYLYGVSLERARKELARRHREITRGKKENERVRFIRLPMKIIMEGISRARFLKRSRKSFLIKSWLPGKFGPELLEKYVQGLEKDPDSRRNIEYSSENVLLDLYDENPDRFRAYWHKIDYTPTTPAKRLPPLPQQQAPLYQLRFPSAPPKPADMYQMGMMRFYDDI